MTAEGRQPRRGEAFSLAGALASAGLGLLLGGAAIFAARMRLSWPLYALWGAGAAALLAAAIIQRRAVVGAMRARGVRFGSNTAALAALVIGIAVLVNYLAVRHYWRWDLTHLRSQSLAPQSVKVLGALKQPVEIIAFYSEGRDPDAYRRAADLLAAYRYAGPRLKTRIIDPDLSPALARQYGVSGYSTTLVVMGDRQEELFMAGEPEITNAILRLANPTTVTIYFTQGNGERDPESPEPGGYSGVKHALTGLGYRVEYLWLTQAPAIPADCDLVVIAGPRRRYDPIAAAAITDYLKRGGAALIMLDPTPFGAALAEVLQPLGLNPMEGVVVEPEGNLGDPAAVTVGSFQPHDITRPFLAGGGRFAAFMVGVRAFERHQPADEAESHPAGGAELDAIVPDGRSAPQVTDLARTSERSWLESDFRGTVRKSPREIGGPLTIAAAVTWDPLERATRPQERSRPPRDAASPEVAPGRAVVLGDSDFASNEFILFSINQDLFLNSIAWLAQAQDRISIPPPPPRRALLVPTPRQARLMALLLVGLPAAAVLVGGLVWWRRR